jgi:HK97 family phage prohead protease
MEPTRYPKPAPGRLGTQSLSFSRNASPPEVNAGRGWTPEAAAAWLRANDYVDPEPNEVETAYRFQQFPPTACDPKSLAPHTDGLPAGVSAVRGRAPGRILEIDQFDLAPLPAGLEVREAGKGSPRLAGHAAVWDQPTPMWPGYKEVIRPGAFSRNLREDGDVRALFNHSPDKPLGRTTVSDGPGSLRVWEDDKGLAFEVQPLDTETGREVVAAVRSGVVDGASFAFRPVVAPEQDRGDYVLREIVDADLVDVSPVVYPQYSGADVGLRSLRSPAAPPQAGDVLAALREAGLTDPQIRETLAATGEALAAHSGSRPRRDAVARALRQQTLDALDS